MQEHEVHFDREKYKALVHLICARIENPRRLSKTKLHKALLYSDLNFFLNHKRPITGETYIKDEFGPVSVHLDEVIAELVEEGAIRTHQITGYSAAIGEYMQNQYISLRAPDVDHFTEAELLIIEKTIQWIKGKSSSDISDFSHTIAWEVAEYDEELPYFTALAYFMRPPSEREMRKGLELLRSRNADRVS